MVRERLLALLSAFFGALAVLLAAVGLYGVVAYTVGRRTRELGVRMALGASRRNVQWLILGETIRLAGAGILLGLPVALGASRFIGSFLYGLNAADPTVLMMSAGLLMVIALLAGFVPSYRASRVDPLTALRYE